MLLGLIAWVAISYAEGGIVGLMLRGDLVAADKLELLAEFFEGLGVLAPLAYVALVTVEVVVAPIPGTILYAPAGIIFGGLWGGAFSLIGNVPRRRGVVHSDARAGPLGLQALHRTRASGAIRAARLRQRRARPVPLARQSVDLVGHRFLRCRRDVDAGVEVAGWNDAGDGAAVFRTGLSGRESADCLPVVDLSAAGWWLGVRRRVRLGDPEVSETRRRDGARLTSPEPPDE